jgi:phage gpG-like protein
MPRPALEVQVSGLLPALQRLNVLPQQLWAALRTTVQRETLELQRHVVEDKLSGQVLNVRTGTLRRSITQVVEEGSTWIRGRVGTNLRYGLAHEFGATIQHPGSRVRTAKALHWVAAGQDVFAMSTRPHTIRLPVRSFLRTGLADRRGPFVAAVRLALGRVLGGGRLG